MNMNEVEKSKNIDNSNESKKEYFIIEKRKSSQLLYPEPEEGKQTRGGIETNQSNLNCNELIFLFRFQGISQTNTIIHFYCLYCLLIFLAFISYLDFH